MSHTLWDFHIYVHDLALERILGIWIGLFSPFLDRGYMSLLIGQFGDYNFYDFYDFYD
jgi:hypothetical protein